jgi:geranylgeranyl diphosphate synthase type II
MAFVLEKYLEEQSARVEAWMGERLDAIAAETPPRLLESMRYSLMGGGKRLRPALCVAWAQAAGGQIGTAVEDAACALEYVHTYSLVHDDLPAMDDDALRRGRPTNHKVFGEAMAILAGDALQTEAFALLADGEEPVRARLCLELSRAAGAYGMVGGQVLDIAEDRPGELPYLVRLHALKTGALIRAACRMGVIAGGGTVSALEAADRYGAAVGLAFQIADDLLDVTSTPEQLGKPAGADAAAGRATFPAVVGLERARQMAEAKVEEAISAAATFEPREGALHAIARYVLERKK